MTTFIDTSVLIDLLQEGSEHHQWCAEQVENARIQGPIVVSDIVYCEFSVGMPDRGAVDAAISEFGLDRCGYSDEALFRAGKAFLAYKQNGGPRESLLPDFLIGALADAAACPLLTRDPDRVHTYFPEVQLIAPQ